MPVASFNSTNNDNSIAACLSSLFTLNVPALCRAIQNKPGPQDRDEKERGTEESPGVSVSAFPRTRLLFSTAKQNKNSQDANIRFISEASNVPTLSLSLESLDSAISSESNCVWGIIPSGKSAKCEWNRNKSLLFFWFLSLLTNYTLTRRLFNKVQKGKNMKKNPFN